MYNVMIVDDEPAIVEGVYDLFLNIDDFDLQLHKAYSADEALETVYTTHMDVVFTDIRMPGMDGMELQRRIAAQWPFCKVVFLTGYNDFTYIQTAIRNNGADYILKTESFEIVEQALRKALLELSEQIRKESTIARARQRMNLALPALRREFLIGLLDNRAADEAALAERFRLLELPFDADAKVMPIIGRVDVWRQELSEADKQLMLYSVENMAGEYFSSLRVQTVHYERSKLIWLIQPAEGQTAEPDKCRLFVHGMLHSLQRTCQELLQLPLSIFASDDFVSWDEAPARYQRLRSLLLRGIGPSASVILRDKEERTGVSDSRGFRKLLARLELLEQLLENGLAAECKELIGEIAACCENAALPPSLKQEAFGSLSFRFLSYLNRSGLSDLFAERFSFDRLLRIEEFGSWFEIGSFFEQAVDFIFECGRHEKENLNRFVISAVNAFIHEHYDEDLSLSRLASIVHLNASYLCRLYKQATGTGLSDYITQYRIAKAKELLAAPGLKIQDVALRTGFDSSAYFGRVFKKAVSMTPQEYRDRLSV